MPDTNIEQSNNASPDRRERQAQEKAARGAEARRAHYKKIGHRT